MLCLYLLGPETDEIFYVGKGIGNRVFSHLTDTEDTEKSRFTAG